MVPQDLDAFDLRLSAGLVLVEEVSAEQHHVHPLLLLGIKKYRIC